MCGGGVERVPPPPMPTPPVVPIKPIVVVAGGSSIPVGVVVRPTSTKQINKDDADDEK